MIFISAKYKLCVSTYVFPLRLVKLSPWIITSASIIFNTRYLASPGYPLRSPTALPLFPKKALSPYKEGYLSQRRPSWDPAAQDEFLEAVHFGAVLLGVSPQAPTGPRTVRNPTFYCWDSLSWTR